MTRTAKKYSDEGSGIDLNPMMDVVFILLIFFVVTASFLQESALDLSPPPSNKSTESVNVPTQITVSSSDEIFMGERRVDKQVIRALLAQKYAEQQEDMAVVVRAHEQSSANTYVQILDAARQASIRHVSLTTYNDD